MRTWIGLSIGFVVSVAIASGGHAADAQRARALGVPFEGTPGPLDAITDVTGVEVGQISIVSGEGPLKVGVGPVTTSRAFMFNPRPPSPPYKRRRQVPSPRAMSAAVPECVVSVSKAASAPRPAK